MNPADYTLFGHTLSCRLITGATHKLGHKDTQSEARES
jgi:hypothetical protein